MATVRLALNKRARQLPVHLEQLLDVAEHRAHVGPLRVATRGRRDLDEACRAIGVQARNERGREPGLR